MLLVLLFVFLIVLLGGFIQGASGFGFGLVAMGFLPIILTLKESTLIVIALLLVASISIIKKIYKYIELKGLLVIISSALVGRIVSFFVLSTYGEMEFLQKLLGFFLIGMVIYLFLNNKKTSSSKAMNPITPVSLGFLGGFIGGVFAVGGPFFVFYFLMLYEEKHKYNANLQVTVVVTSLFTLLLHGVNGDFNSTFYLYFLIGAIGVFIGTQLGLKWFEKLPSKQIKKFAMVMVLVAALNLILLS
ncbi:sulfite exporter TauE/SafE family protein [Halalkalibacter alkalisediminis]|uniref:Probable membrane transporter protein n=1 Tax=Halalkalibacter alkalisediminis TaxID=935616 RepID=A0ABV6NHM6_9BACI|nr:sulfite exporter TauE/SafE family protein [Halalkalibacter alkalisediminis]